MEKGKIRKIPGLRLEVGGEGEKERMESDGAERPGARARGKYNPSFIKNKSIREFVGKNNGKKKPLFGVIQRKVSSLRERWDGWILEVLSLGS
mmetsp:Transcript_43039/g.111411  ORF Transcript_43039/g.111411 Transcript_43039/m.111411 type:complete len:93 (+) Transcript_43039:2668-2946(+)